jgi:protein gp37
MAQDTKIEWAHHTFNPWLGCTKVSPACKHCYAERDFDHRLKQVQWGPNGTRVLTSHENWAKPLKWNRDVEKEYEFAQAQWVADCCVGNKSYPEPELKQFRKRVFCASLADVFEDWQGPIVNSKGERGVVTCADSFWFTIGPVSNCHDLTMDDVRTQLFALIDATPNLDWLLLTKRPENIRSMYLSQHLDGGTTGRIRELMDEGESKYVHPYFRRNVWLGTSVENQEYADKRIPELLKCRDLSPVLFLSCEPLLGPVDLDYPDSLYPDGPEYCCSCSGFECGCRGRPIDPPAYLNKAFGGVDWVIAGGESGPQARPTDPEWFRSLRNQCQAAGVPFLFKQWGEWVPSDHDSVKMSDNEVCPWNDKPRSDVIDTKQRDNSNTVMCRVGKVRAGRVLDGVTHDGFPNE